MRAIGIVLSLLLLAGCAEGRADRTVSGQYAGVLPEDLTQWTDAEICRGASVAPNPAIRAEAQRRDLGDCAPEHLRCRANGYLTASDAYRACRLYLAELQAIEEGRSAPAAIPGIPAVPSSPPAGSGNTIVYSFPDGQRLRCTTLRNLISCF